MILIIIAIVVWTIILAMGFGFCKVMFPATDNIYEIVFLLSAIVSAVLIFLVGYADLELTQSNDKKEGFFDQIRNNLGLGKPEKDFFVEHVRKFDEFIARTGVQVYSQSNQLNPQPTQPIQQSTKWKASIQDKFNLSKLQDLVEAYIYLFPEMPTPKIKFVNRSEVDFELRDANGFATGSKEISIFRDYFYGTCNGDFESPHLHRFIKHELVHNWISFKNITDNDTHGKEFDYWHYQTIGGLPKYKNKNVDPFNLGI